MIRKLPALLAGALLCTLVFGQSVPNGGTITTGQVWTVPQWLNAWQSKFDVSGGTLTAPTINNPAITGGTQNAPAITNPAIAGGTQSAPTITSPTISGGSLSAPTISGTVAGSPVWSGNHIFAATSGIPFEVLGSAGNTTIANNGTQLSFNGSIDAAIVNTGPNRSIILNTAAGTGSLSFNTQGANRQVITANGNSVFSAATSGNTVQVNGGAGAYGTYLQGSLTTSQSNGLIIQAGTNSSDFAASILDATGITHFLTIGGDGSLVAGAASGGGQGLGTGNFTGVFVNGVNAVQTGTFTASATGFSAGAPPATATYVILFGTVAIVNIPIFTGTSNAVTFTVTGLPAAIQPATQSAHFAVGASDNGAEVRANAQIAAGSGTIIYAINGNVNGWTASGGKAGGFVTLTYLLN